MDKYDRQDFIHETIVNEAQKKRSDRIWLARCLAGGVIFGAAALGVFLTGFRISQKQGNVPEETEASTQAVTGSMPANEAELEAVITRLMEEREQADKPQNLDKTIGRILGKLGKCSVLLEAESKSQGMFQDDYSTRHVLNGLIIKRSADSCQILTCSGSLHAKDQLLVHLPGGGEYEGKLVADDSRLNYALVEVKDAELGQDIEQIAIDETMVPDQGANVFWYGGASGMTDSLGIGYVAGIDSQVHLLDGDFEGIHVTSGADPARGSFLINDRGELCGLAISPDQLAEDYSLTEGYGIALSLRCLNPCLTGETDGGKRAMLGVVGQTVTRNMQDTYAMPGGVYVTSLAAKSSAYKAGIQQGDVITRIGDWDITDMESLQASLDLLKPGEEIEAVIYRSSKKGYTSMTLTVKPGKR